MKVDDLQLGESFDWDGHSPIQGEPVTSQVTLSDRELIFTASRLYVAKRKSFNVNADRPPAGARTMTATIYLHSTKESNRDVGQELGLTGEALNGFMYACYEVKLTLEVDEVTGDSVITHVDDRKVDPPQALPRGPA